MAVDDAKRSLLLLQMHENPHQHDMLDDIGKAAGAGSAGHIHMHVLPRWVADANFLSVVSETRVLPETLEETWKRMTAALVAAF